MIALPPTGMCSAGNTCGEEEVGGQEVAVKVLHPGIRDAIQADLQLMRSAARAAEWVGAWAIYTAQCLQTASNFFLSPFHQHQHQSQRSCGRSSSTPLSSNSTTSHGGSSGRGQYPLVCVSLVESVKEFARFMGSQADMGIEAAALARLRSAPALVPNRMHNP